MFFYSRYQKKLAKGEKELTPQERRKIELRNNMILVVVLVIGFGIVVSIAGKFKTEITNYDNNLYVQKDVSDITNLDDIEPLYKYETKEVNYTTIEINDEDLYTRITDEVYFDYEKYHDIYKTSVWHEYNLSDVNYFRFEVATGNITSYYYLLDNKLYKSNELVSDLNDKSKLTLLESLYVTDIYELIKVDMPKTFGDYLEYIVDLNYYIILTSRQNSFNGCVVLDNDEIFELSLINFVDLIGYFQKSCENNNEIIVEVGPN